MKHLPSPKHNPNHRYVFNKKEGTIIHKYFDTEQMDRTPGSTPTRGKWVSKNSIPTVAVGVCKCGGKIFGPAELPQIFRPWGLCGKCGAEWKER
jgi:hypothetical protein